MVLMKKRKQTTVHVCDLCRQPGDGILGQGLLLGPLHGSGSGSAKPRYLHHCCAVWTPNIFETKDYELQGVERAVKEGLRRNCSFCGEVSQPTTHRGGQGPTTWEPAN